MATTPMASVSQPSAAPALASSPIGNAPAWGSLGSLSSAVSRPDFSRVVLPEPLPASARPVPPPRLTAAEKALKQSLEPKEFRDVHFYAFTRRTVYADGSLRVDHPLPMVAIGSILKETEHFSKLLTSGFSEANLGSHAAIRQHAHNCEYDYDTDSDLDEFEEPGSMPSTNVSSLSKDKVKELDGTAMADECGTNILQGAKLAASSSAPEEDVAAKHHQILIPNIAHRTLKACIFYLYTGRINFLPLSSSGPAQRSFALLTTSNLAPACSPKSMYRLAESYGISELQEMAYQEIISGLTPENIVQETFSSFFARYDRLREHAVSYLSRHYHDRSVQDALPDFIDRIVMGDLIHAGPALRSLLGLRVTRREPGASKRKKKAHRTDTTHTATSDMQGPGSSQQAPGVTEIVQEVPAEAPSS